VRKAAPGKPLPRGVRQPAGRGATAEQLRQQRLMLDQQRRQREARWWVINQNAVKDLHSRQHHAAGGEAIGTILNADRRMRWRTSHAVGAITLLILSFFFASMAVGAQSMGIAVLAFLCLSGCIAFFTVEHSKRRFPQPVPAPPLIGQHRLEDLIVEDDPPRGAPVREPEPSTISALNDMFTPRPEAAPEADSVAPAKAAATPRPNEAPSESAPAPLKPAEAQVETPSTADGSPEAASEPVRAVAAEPVPESLPDEPAKAAIADEPANPAVEAEPVADEPEPDEPAKTTLAAESPRIIVIESVNAGPAVEDEPVQSDPQPMSAAASESAPPPGGAPGPAPGVAFSLPSEQVGGDASGTAPTPPPPAGDTSPPKGPIAEAATRLKAPSPPRQRTSTEGRSLAHDLAELLLSEQRLGGTDVTDVAATLVVADLQRSVEFYTDALGLTIADRTDEAAVLDAGFGKILLWERRDAPPGETGVMHLTFEVGDIDTTFAKMNEAGVEFLHLPRTALLGQHYEMRAAAFRDPDGHGLAITEHRERD
jgi:catechol 2,3-dioxygenase-like lactoylglutathione lyase family enzyme